MHCRSAPIGNLTKTHSKALSEYSHAKLHKTHCSVLSEHTYAKLNRNSSRRLTKQAHGNFHENSLYCSVWAEICKTSQKLTPVFVWTLTFAGAQSALECVFLKFCMSVLRQYPTLSFRQFCIWVLRRCSRVSFVKFYIWTLSSLVWVFMMFHDVSSWVSWCECSESGLDCPFGKFCMWLLIQCTRVGFHDILHVSAQIVH